MRLVSVECLCELHPVWVHDRNDALNAIREQATSPVDGAAILLRIQEASNGERAEAHARLTRRLAGGRLVLYVRQNEVQ